VPAYFDVARLVNNRVVVGKVGKLEMKRAMPLTYSRLLWVGRGPDVLRDKTIPGIENGEGLKLKGYGDCTC
jgi:hypothetical protein